MANMNPTIWGIHAGKTGDAHSLFMKKSVVAIGFTRMGDLSTIPASRDAFKAAVAKAYPDLKPGAIPNYTGQLFRFVHEMKKGDLIVYASWRVPPASPPPPRQGFASPRCN
jgi:restriction system protein